jgi:hypothetical protein
VIQGGKEKSVTGWALLCEGLMGTLCVYVCMCVCMCMCMCMCVCMLVSEHVCLRV